MQAEAQIRDAKGEWRPSPRPFPAPCSTAPEALGDTQTPLELVWPYNLIYAASLVVMLYLTPGLETTAHFGMAG